MQLWSLCIGIKVPWEITGWHSILPVRQAWCDKKRWEDGVGYASTKLKTDKAKEVDTCMWQKRLLLGYADNKGYVSVRFISLTRSNNCDVYWKKNTKGRKPRDRKPLTSSKRIRVDEEVVLPKFRMNKYLQMIGVRVLIWNLKTMRLHRLLTFERLPCCSDRSKNNSK